MVFRILEESNMGLLGGLDVGFGANMQIIRTNYLVVQSAAGGTVQQHANFLTLHNNACRENARGNSNLVCDYIATAHAPSDAGSQNDPRVIETAAGSHTAWPVAGIGTQASNNDKANMNIIACLSLGGMQYDDATFTAGVAVTTGAITDATSDIVNSTNLVSAVGASVTDAASTGACTTLNLAAYATDLLALCNTGTVTLTDAALGANFVEKGNAAGTTATTIATAGLSAGAESAGIISTVCFVGVL